MKFWKIFFSILGIDLFTGRHILDGRKGGPGCGWVMIFTIVFFPLWLDFKLFKSLFKHRS